MKENLKKKTVEKIKEAEGKRKDMNKPKIRRFIQWWGHLLIQMLFLDTQIQSRVFEEQATTQLPVKPVTIEWSRNGRIKQASALKEPEYNKILSY